MNHVHGVGFALSVHRYTLWRHSCIHDWSVRIGRNKPKNKNPLVLFTCLNLPNPVVMSNSSWRYGLCDFPDICCSSLVCMAAFSQYCFPCLVTHMLHRLKYSVSFRKYLFALLVVLVVSNIVFVLLYQFVANEFVLILAFFLNLVPVALLSFVRWKTRHFYPNDIETCCSCCECCEDLCCALACSCCVQIQTARQLDINKDVPIEPNFEKCETVSSMLS